MHNHFIQELQDAIGNRSADRKVTSLRKVTDLFLDQGSRLGQAQIEIFDSLLLSFIDDCDIDVLVELSRKLAPVPFAPVSVVRKLATDLNVTVASPVLTQSPVLSSNDLMEIATSRGQGHLLAISGRTEIGATLTQALIDLGDKDVLRRVAGNEGATISRAGLLRLVAASKGDPLLAEKTGLRADLPVRLLHELLDHSAGAVHARLMAKAPASLRGEIQSRVETIALESKRQAERPRDLRSALALVERLVENRQLTENKLLEFAKDRQYETIIAALAAMTGAPIPLIQPLMRIHRHDGLMTACRAADLSWETAKAVILSRLLSLPAAEIEQLRKKYEEVSFSSARRALTIWQEQTMKPRRAG
ncbi:MAG: DUF2336 domain-containing protein [Pseudomonadota bacterium]|nr:DUF2336 domain-containing protein [Afipia sp.]